MNERSNRFERRLAVEQLQAVAVTFLVGIGCWCVGCQGPAGPDGDDAFLSDSLAPVIEWLSPQPGVVIDSGATLTAHVTDDRVVWQMLFYIGGLKYDGVLTDSSAGIYSYRWNATRWPEGPYPLMARARDGDRNTSTTPVIIVQVEH